MRAPQVFVPVVLLVAAWHSELSAQATDRANLPDSDTTLVLEAKPTLVRVRLAQPGYVMVFAVRSDESWYLAYPQPNELLTFKPDTLNTLSLWQPHRRAWPPPNLSSPRPSDAICDHAAGSPADGFCDLALAQAMRTTSGFQSIEPLVSHYIVVELIGPANLRNMFRGMAKRPRSGGVALEAWVLQEVAANAPIQAWTTTDFTP